MGYADSRRKEAYFLFFSISEKCVNELKSVKKGDL